MKNLYRRYRPLKLGDVVGQEQVTVPLQKALESSRFGHAYLFVGPRGCGKTSVARILAHEVNGFKYEPEDDYVDIIEIDGASNRGIDNIRELREKVAIAPTIGKYKVYIIDEVHMLTKEAFNALLKTLEEPPEHVIFIMATTDAYKVPVTITSRAQTYTFKLASLEVMQKHLKEICEKEGIKITDDALKVIAKRGGGSFRDSLSLLDQISTLSENEIDKELVIKAMGLPEDEKIEQLLDSYATGDIKNVVDGLKELLSSGVKAETLAEEMIANIIENLRPELMPLLSKLPDVRAPFAEARLLVALVNVKVADGHSQKAASLGIATGTAVATSPAPTVVNSTTIITNTPVLESPIIATDVPAVDFDWAQFLDVVRGMNDAIYLQLKSVEYAVNGNTLDIYPTKRITKTILGRDNNKKILADATNGFRVVVHEVGENSNAKKDELVSKISDIMGGEVKDDSGGNPF